MAQSVSEGQWNEEKSQGYWKKSVRLQVVLLAIWFVVPFVFGILLAEPLNEVEILDFPLSYWIAQNGAIFVFVALIFYFAKRMDHLDHEYEVHEEDLDASVRQKLERKMQKKTGSTPYESSTREV
ncbi:MAG: DUF4212 domain-containing protein [Acidimicrobiia bacterium]